MPLRRLGSTDTNLPLAKLLGALAFSAALTLIVLLGGELFTGCILVMSVSLYDGRVRLAGTSVSGRWPTWQSPGHSGALPAAGRLRLQRGAVGGYLALIVPGKLSAPWYLLLLRGVLCNFWCASRVRRLPPPERDRQAW